MALFPSPHERTVASALLLLSTSRSPASHSLGSDDDFVSLKEKIASRGFSEEGNLSLFSSSSRPKSSSVTSDGSSKDSRAPKKLRFSNSAARSRLMKFKVSRKRRSKVCWISSDDRKTVVSQPISKTSRSEPTESSSISSTTTAASSTQSHSVTRRMQKFQLEPREKLKKNKSSCGSSSGSSQLRHQADSILKLLSCGSSSEVRIRQQLGDSPDTSKALRMLLKMGKIKRKGMGGRCDPYIYKIA